MNRHSSIGIERDHRFCLPAIQQSPKKLCFGDAAADSWGAMDASCTLGVEMTSANEDL